MEDIIMEFSGWAKVSPDSARFENCNDTEDVINGEEWQKLSPDKKEDYVIQDAIAFIRDCDNNDWTLIDTFTEED